MSPKLPSAFLLLCSTFFLFCGIIKEGSCYEPSHSGTDTSNSQSADADSSTAGTFLDKLRALWKASGGDENNEEESPTSRLIRFRGRTNFQDEQLPQAKPNEEVSRQFKVPVRLGLVRFSSRKPTILPKVSSASSFPVLMPSDLSLRGLVENNATAASERELTMVYPELSRSTSLNTNYMKNAYMQQKRMGSDMFRQRRDRPLLALDSSTDPGRQRIAHRLEEKTDQTDADSWARHFQGPEVAHDVCPSISDWVARSEALDPYGNRLTVLQRIPVNDTVVNQYFFETYCAMPRTAHSANYYQGRPFTECRGINKDVWNSRCKENFIWTYGKVITVSGDVGWSVIAIRGSCGCAIWKKPQIEDVIGRRRKPVRKPNRNL